MNGIVFFKTSDLPLIKQFYSKVLELPEWLDQGTCAIFKIGNQLIGFCQGEFAETAGTITFFLASRCEVDAAYNKFKEIAISQPQPNPGFSIYHFWGRDPEGRSLEFQCFEHGLKPHLAMDEGLTSRRSIRKYLAEPVEEALLNQVFELCRYAPTANNAQSYYYIVIKQREILSKIVALRGPAGDPILAAPYAIAVASRGNVSRRKVQDACIAAYHLLLAAKAYGLGTCWVTDMDKDEVKELLGVPKDDYIACLTPIGFPAESFDLPKRHEIASFVRQL
jgi:nitroreductase